MAWNTRRTFVVGDTIPLAATLNHIGHELDALAADNKRLRLEEAALARRLAVAEGEVSMAWAVIDWADSEEDDDDPEAPADLHGDS